VNSTYQIVANKKQGVISAFMPIQVDASSKPNELGLVFGGVSQHFPIPGGIRYFWRWKYHIQRCAKPHEVFISYDLAGDKSQLVVTAYSEGVLKSFMDYLTQDLGIIPQT
jgi:hypothetical protein